MVKDFRGSQRAVQAQAEAAKGQLTREQQIVINVRHRIQHMQRFVHRQLAAKPLELGRGKIDAQQRRLVEATQAQAAKEQAIQKREAAIQNVETLQAQTQGRPEQFGSDFWDVDDEMQACLAAKGHTLLSLLPELQTPTRRWFLLSG